MDKRSRRRASVALGELYSKMADKLNFYVVTNLDDDSIITVGHREGRLKWN